MTRTYEPLEKYLRSLPTAQEEVTLSFESIEQIMDGPLPASAYEDRAWWGNQEQGTYVEIIAWMSAGWMVDTVDLMEKWVKFVRQ